MVPPGPGGRGQLGLKGLITLHDNNAKGGFNEKNNSTWLDTVVAIHERSYCGFIQRLQHAARALLQQRFRDAASDPAHVLYQG